MFNRIQSTALQVATKPVFTWLAISVLTLSVALLTGMPTSGGGGG